MAGVEGLSPRRKIKQLGWQPRLSAHVGFKGLSRGLATPSPDRPPDAGSRNPGAVGTATWAEIQGVPERTVQSYRKPSENVHSGVTLGAERFALPRLRNSLVRGEHNAQQIAARRLIGTGAGADRGAAS
jgi:hypothetical protein